MRFGFALVAVAGSFLASALPVAAQGSGCPIADDALVSVAVGASVTGHAANTIVPGLVACNFEDARGGEIGVTRQVGAFGPNDPTGPAALAAMFVSDVPDAVQAQFAALNQAGIQISAPGYELASPTGLGDAALWVKTTDLASLFVQRGTDVYAFETDDPQDAQARLTALAQLVLKSP
jgi:hypothetical protein